MPRQKTQQSLMNALLHTNIYFFAPLLHYHFQLFNYNNNHILTLCSLKPLQWISNSSCVQQLYVANNGQITKAHMEKKGWFWDIRRQTGNFASYISQSSEREIVLTRHNALHLQKAFQPNYILTTSCKMICNYYLCCTTEEVIGQQLTQERSRLPVFCSDYISISFSAP